jgi:hypothetical protein
MEELSFTLADLIEIVTLLALIVGAYYRLSNQIKEKETNQSFIKQDLEEVKLKHYKLKEEVNDKFTSFFEKLLIVEKNSSAQLNDIKIDLAETNMFLKQNFQHLSTIIDIHTQKFDEYDKNINDFYKTYDLKTKKNNELD